MSARFYLAVYDMPDDRRRRKLHTLLQDYGTPVQYSVFECIETTAAGKEVAREEGVWVV